MFYLIRHGEPDYSERGGKIYRGFGEHLSGLTEAGARQIQEAAKDPRLQGGRLILSSPYTRAVQTAAILSRETGLHIIIETDLHEWLANRNYVYEDDETAESAYLEYISGGGEWPAGVERAWETASALRARVRNVLARYASHGKVIVVSHGMAIQAVTRGKHPAFGEIVEFEL